MLRRILEDSLHSLEIEDPQWKVYIIEGATLRQFVSAIQAKLDAGHLPLEQEYNVYPPKLKLEYHRRRKKLAVDMYGLLGIAYKDKAKRFEHLKRNWSFFGAPLGLLFTMRCAPEDRLRQFCFLGSYLQSVMISLKQHGIDSCAQEAWANFSRTVHAMLDIGKEELLFCGMGVGYGNETAPVNTLRADRMEMSDFIKIRTAKL